MNFAKRAALHTIRKKGKGIILLCLLTVMTTLILTCFSVRNASDTAALNVRQSLKASFTMDMKATNGQMTQSIVAQIRSIEGIKDNYNLRSNSYAEFQNVDGTPLEVLTEGAFDIVDGFEHAGRLYADMYSERDSFFTEKGFELTAGRHITGNDKNTVLIHAYLAKTNNLKVGDTIRLALNEKMAENYNGQGVDAEIVGIYTNSEPQQESSLLSHMFYENIVFTDPHTYWQLHGNGGALAYDYGDFYVDDPANLDTIIEQVKEIASVDWSVCGFLKHDVNYQNAKNALSALNNMVEVMLVVVVIVSMLLLILILALWVRSRVHEAGILLSVGFTKGNILMQHICETMMLAVIAFILAAGISAGISQNVGNNLLTKASASEYELVNTTDGTVQEDEIQLTEIEVKVSLQECIIVFLAGSFMVMFAVTISVVPILLMKPKNILSQMS